MNNEQFLTVLCLAANTPTTEIDAAFKIKLSELNEKITSAPTDALKAKFQTLIDELTQAKNQFASTTQQSSSPLSQTKMADLPGMGVELNSQTLEVGTTLSHGRYEIKAFIAQGGMGAVYRAFDKNRAEDIAIKVMLPALMQNDTARERFLNEARLSSQLSHPNIVNVYDVQQDEGLCFLTMELLEGQDLRELMENRKLARQNFSMEEVLDILTPIFNALDHAHEVTVHRDIKPENIFLTEDGKYKLMDFGIARVMSTSQRTQTGAASGTAYYMAPEQLKGASDIDGRADQYALAVLAYELLSGEVPAGAVEPLHELIKGFNKKISAAIQKALSPKPENRFANFTEFKTALQAKSGDVRVPALPIKTISIAAAIILGIGLIGLIFSSVDFSGLVPESAEVVAQRKAEVAKLTGEIKTYKRRLDNGRRNLDSDIRDAKRENNKKLKALEHWQRLTENYIFNGSALTDLEGELSMGESLLREKSFTPANETLTKVRDGYKSLWKNFNAAEKLYSVEKTNKQVRSHWLSYKINKNLPDPTEAQQAKNSELIAKQAMSDSNFTSALQSVQQAKQYWVNAKTIGKKLVNAIQENKKARNNWLKRKQNYKFDDTKDIAQAKQHEAKANFQQSEGGFTQAILRWQQSKQYWKGAYNSVSMQVSNINNQREKVAAIRKHQSLIAEKTRQHLIRQVTPNMINIPASSFLMGKRTAYGGSRNTVDQPIHRVKISNFRISETEVTFANWDACIQAKGCTHKPKDHGWGRENRPVINVSYNDINQEYIPWLNKLTGKRYRLPTESEWEYVCKANKEEQYLGVYCGSISISSLKQISWYESNSGNKTHPVKQKKESGFGVYDLMGNVSEWTQDCWNENYNGAPNNGVAWTHGDCSKHVIRGGSWNDGQRNMSSTLRDWNNNTRRNFFLGFRLAQD